MKIALIRLIPEHVRKSLYLRRVIAAPPKRRKRHH